MPLYEYKCADCKKIFEERRSQVLSADLDPGLPCPTCQKLASRIAVSRPSEPIFKGSGFYQTDYKKTRKPHSS
jgi:putative FmdB family regulatory protein